MDRPVRARLITVAPEVQRSQQALEAIYAAPNPQQRIPVGLQAEVRLAAGPPVDAVAVPRSAVLTRAGNRLVYLQLDGEDFEQRTVEVLDESGERAVLRPGLPAGAKVVAKGAQVLLSEQYKEAILLIDEGRPSQPDKE